MDKLANYGSDDDYEDSPQHKRTTEFRVSTGADDRPSSYHPRRRDSSEADVNYEEVQMDLSEDTNSSSSSGSSSGSSTDSLSKQEKRPPTNDRGGRKDDRSYKQNNDDRYKRNSKDSPKTTTTTTTMYKSRRDEDRSSSSTSGKSERFKDKSRPDDKHRRRNSRDRYDRRSRRSSSRDRQRSRSPPPPPPSSASSSRRPDYRNKRSNSRERGGAKSGYTRRFDRASNKMAQLEKLGIEIKTPDCQFMSPLDLQRSMEDQKRKGEMENRFFMPGITGRFREQIERRKMLWQKKEPEKKEAPVAAATVVGGSSAGRVWESTTFAQDSDGKVANKFKRLMGIRGKADESKPATDNLKKQEEMFSSMEAQYEVARTATHTMRGVGLGFGSFQR